MSHPSDAVPVDVARATVGDGSRTGDSSATSARATVPTRSGSIMLQQTITSPAHVNVCRPWISWKKGNISEYVSKPRVFFDHFHHQIVLFTGAPPNKMWFSDRKTQTWMDFPVNLPPHNDIIGAQFSPDKSHVALRVSDKEVKVLSTATGEVVTARSCRGTSSRMVSVHWLDFSATDSSGCLFLLFVTNAGVELYELTTEKEKPTVGAGGLAGAAVSSGLSPTSKSKLRHVKTATYALVYHWLLVDENILMLVDGNNVFQAYRLSSKHIQKICKFELDCAGTSLHPPAMVQFHREQISLVWLYGRMVILFVNEQKGQLHLLSLVAPGQSDEMEQTHVFDLFAPGKYDISHIDNVLLVHNAATKTTMIFDVRSEGKNTIAEPLAIGPPLAFVQGAATGAINGAGANGGSSSGLHFFDPASLSALSAGASASAVDARLAGAATASTTGGMSSLAPASFHPYVKWTFLAPSYVWESTGDQQQGNLWTLQLNLHQIARSWPHAKRTRLVDFLLKRSSVAAKQLVLEVILQIVCTEPASLALLSRLFSLLNRMNYDHRMSPNAPLTNAASIANLPLRPPFSNPPSAAPTAPNSQAASPAPMGGTRPPSQSVSPYRPTTSLPGSTIGSPLAQGQLPTFHSRITSPVHHNRSTSVSLAASNSFSATAAAATAAAAALAADPLPAVDIDDSISVLSCEMVDVSLLQSQPLTVEHNLHGYMLVSQLDVFLHVFERARPHIPIAQLIPAVVEYMRSLHRHFLKVDDLLNDLLVSLLLQDGRHYECHQYLQYHILNDSLPIANRLIQCAPVYAPAYQLGIDMLYRLNQIPRLAKVLLQRGEVLAALKLVPSFRAGAAGGLFDTWGLFPRDFLQVASNTGCDVTFYHTYRFFEQRNVALRGQTAFVSGDGCDEFVRAFQDKFGPAANEHRQYLNLGDDDDDDDDDDDIEYFGPKPSILSLSAAAPSSSLPPPSSTAGASSSESVRLPTPEDLSTTIPSCLPTTVPSGAEDEEDAQAESGLGAEPRAAEKQEMSTSPMQAVEADGSFFGGHTERPLAGGASTAASTTSSNKKQGRLQPELAL